MALSGWSRAFVPRVARLVASAFCPAAHARNGGHGPLTLPCVTATTVVSKEDARRPCQLASQPHFNQLRMLTWPWRLVDERETLVQSEREEAL